VPPTTVPCIAFPFIGDSIGGSHISASLLMSAIATKGFAPVAIVHRAGLLTDWLMQRGVEVVVTNLPHLSAGGVAALLRMAPVTLKLAGFLRERDVALVHANDGAMITTWMAAARLAGCTAVAHRRTKWSPSRLPHFALRLADRIIAISDFVRDSMPEGLRRRTAVIANPFDFSVPSRQQARAAAILLAGADVPLVAFVGTLQAQKRPDVFLRAAQAIRRQRPDARFLVIGRDGGQADQSRTLAEQLGVADAVVFAGFRSDATLLLGGCDLLLAPAVDEGQGRSLVEAMAAGVPVVAAASGGHCELVHANTGVLVTPDDPQTLARAALDLLDHPEKARGITEAARLWAQNTFSVEAHAAAVIAIYRQLLRVA
jgi:glycosyltransferase involved in cell wall biosynthesis